MEKSISFRLQKNLEILKGTGANSKVGARLTIPSVNGETTEGSGFPAKALLEWLTCRGYELQVIGPKGKFNSLDRQNRFCNLPARYPVNQAKLREIMR